jgi:predicted site-specific integrase-resolvase
LNNEIDTIIIENKDRLCRFGFELFENLCKCFNTKIIVTSNIEDKTYEQELTEDLISIIHYFSMKSYSNRRKLNKAKEILEASDND